MKSSCKLNVQELQTNRRAEPNNVALLCKFNKLTSCLLRLIESGAHSNHFIFKMQVLFKLIIQVLLPSAAMSGLIICQCISSGNALTADALDNVVQSNCKNR